MQNIDLDSASLLNSGKTVNWNSVKVLPIQETKDSGFKMTIYKMHSWTKKMDKESPDARIEECYRDRSVVE